MTKRKKHPRTQQAQTDVLSRPWTPLVRCVPDPLTPEDEIYRNSRYQVHLRRWKAHNEGPDLIHLSFRRLNHGIFIPYRDKMRLKDELVGPDCEGVELLPARSREVDTANQFHIWIVDDPTFRFSFGFTERIVTDVSLGGTVQQPWPPDERPADCLSAEQIRALLKKRGVSF